MRSVWSQAARPKARLERHLTSTTSHAPIAQTIRQATSAPTRRRLTFSDAFTFLLAPVLGAALIVDTNWKDKRRKEWAQKISEVEAETKHLRAQQVQKWQSIQFRSLQLGAAYQRRQHSTAARLCNAEEDPENLLEIPEWEDPAQRTLLHWPVPTQEDITNHREDEPVYAEETFAALRRFQRLLAIKLALQLTIHLHTGTSPRFIVRQQSELSELYNSAETFKFNDINAHIRKLKLVRKSMASLSVALQGTRLAKEEPMNESSRKLEATIHDISAKLASKKDSMPLRTFITSFTRELMSSDASPTAHSYLAMIVALSKVSHSELAMQIIFTLDQSRHPLNDNATFVILRELGKRKFVHHFDSIMNHLTKKHSNMNFTSRWTWDESEGVQLPIPINKHPRLLQILITCALSFDQPHKAEAWASIFQKNWYGDGNTDIILNNFLRYYAATGNWRKGAMWLDAAQQWSVDIGTNRIFGLQKIVLSMLHLCVVCDKEDVYKGLLKAAVDSRIGLFEPGLRWRYWPPSRRAVFSEWYHEQSLSARNVMDSRPDGEKAQEFQRQARFVLKASKPSQQEVPFILQAPDLQDTQSIEMPFASPLTTSPGDTPYVAPVPSTLASTLTGLNAALNKAKEWRRLYQEQRLEVEKLKLKLDRSERRPLFIKQLDGTNVADLQAVRQTASPHSVVLHERIIENSSPPEGVGKKHELSEATAPSSSKGLETTIEIIQILIERSGDNLRVLTHSTERMSSAMLRSVDDLYQGLKTIEDVVEETAQELQVFADNLQQLPLSRSNRSGVSIRKIKRTFQDRFRPLLRRCESRRS